MVLHNWEMRLQRGDTKVIQAESLKLKLKQKQVGVEVHLSLKSWSHWSYWSHWSQVLFSLYSVIYLFQLKIGHSPKQIFPTNYRQLIACIIWQFLQNYIVLKALTVTYTTLFLVLSHICVLSAPWPVSNQGKISRFTSSTMPPASSLICFSTLRSWLSQLFVSEQYKGIWGQWGTCCFCF